jgi:hypothetical protein
MTTTDFETLRFKVKDGVAWVRLNRPDRLNAFTPEMWAEMRTLGRELLADPGDIRVLVVSGEGRAFSSGIDTSVFSSGFGVGDLADDTPPRHDDPSVNAILTAQDAYNWLAEVPFVTRLLLKGSGLLRVYWYVPAGLLAAAAFGVRKGMKNMGHSIVLDRMILSLPLFGELAKKVAVSRFVSTLGMLVRSGVPILESVEIARGTLGNAAIGEEIELIYQNVQTGRPLSEKMFASRNIPVFVANMVLTGEQTGRLPETLEVVNRYYDEEVQSALRNIFSRVRRRTLRSARGATAPG